MSFGDSSVVKETPTTFQAHNGTFVLDPIRLLYTPGEAVNVSMTSSITVRSGEQAKVIPLTVVAQAFFRGCKRGERETDSRECFACPPDQYILASDSKGACQGCPIGLECFGGDKIGPKPEFWRFDSWIAKAIPCLNPSACLGSTVPLGRANLVTCKERRDDTFCYTGFCEHGYEGNLCTSCSDGFAKSGDFCASCTNNPMFYVVLVLVILVAIFFIVFTVRNALKVKDATQINKPKTSILVKVFLNYVQLVSIVGSFQFQWPEQIKTMFEVQNKVASSPSVVFSVDCLLPNQTTSTRAFFTKLLLISISPLILIMIGMIVWLVIFMVRKAEFSLNLFRSNLTTTFVVILFMLHATLVQNSILAFR